MIRNDDGPRGNPGDRTASTQPAQARAAPSTVIALGAARRRRQAASARMGLLPCGACTDPLPCDLRRWCPVWDGPSPAASLDLAADYFDGLGVCVCWVVPRRHREAS
jgi:hypothetical protein